MLMALPERRPRALLADKGYDADAIRADLAGRRVKAVIPGRSNRTVPIQYDRELYKKRNVVEGSFALLKQWRGLATRYDKHVVTYRGGVVLAAVLLWLDD